MKKNLKRVLLTFVVMLCSMSALAEYYTGSYGTNVTWSLDTETGLLKIIGSGEMKYYSVGYAPWYSYRSSITIAEISDGITSIGDFAFRGCSGLTSITIPESVTSIGESAFEGCSGITSITIPEYVTSIGSNAFCGCSGLTSISIPESVTSIRGGAFSDCSGLISITIPKSVTRIGKYAFTNCPGLDLITIEAGNPSYDSRENCNAIIESSTNTLIAGCKATIIPNSITSISSAAFYRCYGLTSITIPESVTGISSDAFGDCSGLTSITIPKSVTSISSVAFTGCYNVDLITVDAGNPSYDSRENCNAIIEKSTNTLITGCKTTIIPNSVTSISRAAFFHCSGLTSITIPEGVTSIGYGVFWGCSGLTSITIPESVTSIGDWAFTGCSELTELTSKAAVPPSMGSFVFSRETVRAGTLYVPAESVEAYKLASEWSDWGTIKAICSDIRDDVPSSLVNEQKTFENVSSDIPFDGEEETYDLQGRRTGSRKGLNIIRRQDGSVRKVLR